MITISLLLLFSVQSGTNDPPCYEETEEVATSNRLGIKLQSQIQFFYPYRDLNYILPI